MKVVDQIVYCDYYLNKPLSLDEINKLLDKICVDTLMPFKISVDLGYIVEDTKNVTYDKKYDDKNWIRSISSKNGIYIIVFHVVLMRINRKCCCCCHKIWHFFLNDRLSTQIFFFIFAEVD